MLHDYDANNDDDDYSYDGFLAHDYYKPAKEVLTGVLTELNTRAVEWTIENFSSYLDAKSSSLEKINLRSPDFRASNYPWYIIMSLNNPFYKGFVSLYLYTNYEICKRIEMCPDKSYIEVTFALKTIHGEIFNEQNGSCDVHGKYDLAYVEHFIEKSKLLEKKDELLSSDSLTVTCMVQVQDDKPDMLTRLYTLSTNFKDMFTSQKNVDLFINVKGKRFSVHKFILAARCPVLSAKIEDEISKKKSGIVNIIDCDPKVFYMFLLYLYSGELNFLNCDAFSLYKIASKYDMPELKLLCIDFMIRSLSVKNVCQTYVLGHSFNENELLDSVQAFFENNFNEIISSESWVTLMKENCKLANTLLKRMAPKISIKE